MKVQLRNPDGAKSVGVGRLVFKLLPDGTLDPEPTPVQWLEFGTHQSMFRVVELSEGEAVEVTTPPVSVVVAPPHEEVFDPDVATASQEDPGEEDGAPQQESFFADDVDDINDETPPAKPYGEMKYEELKAACQERAIPVWRASREELISRLNAYDLGHINQD